MNVVRLLLRITSLDTCSWASAAFLDVLHSYPGNHFVVVEVGVQGDGRHVFEMSERFDCDGFDPDLTKELGALGFTVMPLEAAA